MTLRKECLGPLMVARDDIEFWMTYSHVKYPEDLASRHEYCEQEISRILDA